MRILFLALVSLFAGGCEFRSQEVASPPLKVR
jgi:hypothetical protein